MEFRVAETIGITVDELENNMSHKEFLEWCMYLAINAEREKAAYDKAKKKSRPNAKNKHNYMG